jgi:hypothetical protein
MSAPLPDACAADAGAGNVVLAANRKARQFLNGRTEPRLTWHRVESPDGVLASPKYRAIEIERGPGLWAMLSALHEGGFASSVFCPDCDCLHPVEGEFAARVRAAALAGSTQALPAHKTVQ